MTARWSLKRCLLHSLIAALVLSAVFGIYVFLFGSFGETEVRILLSTLDVSYYSLMSLACAVAWEKRRTRVLSLPGLTTCMLGFVFLLLCIWVEFHQPEDFVWKTAAILGIFSFSFAQASVLTLARLKPRLAWVSWTAVVSIFSLAIVISTMIVWEIDDEWWFRAIGVLAIVDSCASLSIPLLYKLGGSAAPEVTGQPYPRIELICPRCGHQGEYSVGRIECTECSLRIRVEVSEKPDVEEDPPFQFSLRSLLLVTLIAAVGLGLLGSRLRSTSSKPPQPPAERPAR
jgi:hypothetical protein